VIKMIEQKDKDYKAVIYRMESCSFKRNEISPFEFGLILNEGDLGIIDSHGNQVKEVWTWEREYSFSLETRFFVDHGVEE